MADSNQELEQQGQLDAEGGDPNAEGNADDQAGKAADGEGGSGADASLDEAEGKPAEEALAEAEKAKADAAAAETARTAAAAAAQKSASATATATNQNGQAESTAEVDEAEEALAPHREAYTKADNTLSFYKKWQAGKVAPEVLEKHGLPLWHEMDEVDLADHRMRIQEAVTARNTAQREYNSVKETVGTVASEVKGFTSLFNRAVTLCEKAGFDATPELGDFIFGRASARGGAAWLSEAKRATEDIKAFAKSKGIGATAAAGAKPGAPAGKAAPGLQTKKEVVAVGTGKSGGSNAAAKAQGVFSADDMAILAEDGITNIKTSGYTEQELRAIISDNKQSKARVAARSAGKK